MTSTTNRSAFTMIELMTSILIIAALASLLIPALQKARESSRRLACVNNLKQLALAALNYESTHGCFPLGIDHKYALLPFMEQPSLYTLGESRDVGSENEWGILSQHRVPFLECPSDSGARVLETRSGNAYGSSYHANSGTGLLANGFNGIYGYGEYAGVIYPDRFIRAADILDGLSQTAAFSEALLPNQSARLTNVWITAETYFEPKDIQTFSRQCDRLPNHPANYGYLDANILRGFPWHGGGMGVALYNHTLSPNRPSCSNGSLVLTGIYTANSMHPGGVNLAYADGHVSFVNQQIDRQTWIESGSHGSDEFVYPF